MIPGCYNPSIEGFADAGTSSAAPSTGGASSTSSSASVADTTKPQVDPKAAQEVSKNVQKVEATTNAKAKKEGNNGVKAVSAEEFKSATGGLFKLGEMPSEHKDGPHLDAGKTIMQAMSTFDPNTISSMTSDTKKLLETQKSLMSMLNQMRPVLADGRELLSTFSGMFGGNGNGGASLFNKP
jgi:hypothetical protein